jgi:hypothetical protein
MFESMGFWGSLAGLIVGAAAAVAALGTSIIIPSNPIVPDGLTASGPYVFGLTGVGAGAVLGGLVGAFFGGVRALFQG